MMLAALRRLLGSPEPKRSAVTRRTARPRDYQRAKVYRWEQAHVFPHAGERLSLDACRELVAAAYGWAERPRRGAAWSPPQVQDGRGRRHACGSRAVIKLPRWARTRAIVLHECAHGLAPDQHGPQFVATYVALLEQFVGLDRDTLALSLRASRIDMAARDGSAAKPGQ